MYMDFQFISLCLPSKASMYNNTPRRVQRSLFFVDYFFDDHLVLVVFISLCMLDRFIQVVMLSLFQMFKCDCYFDMLISMWERYLHNAGPWAIMACVSEWIRKSRLMSYSTAHGLISSPFLACCWLYGGFCALFFHLLASPDGMADPLFLVDE